MTPTRWYGLRITTVPNARPCGAKCSISNRAPSRATTGIDDSTAYSPRRGGSRKPRVVAASTTRCRRVIGLAIPPASDEAVVFMAYLATMPTVSAGS